MKLFGFNQYTLISSVLIIVFITACSSIKFEKKQTQISYINPVIDRYLADPFIFSEGGVYYMFGSHKSDDGKYLPIFSSTNLNDWKFENGAVINGKEDDWNYKHFWAPEVIKIKDTYYLYYTASKKHSPENINNRVGVATSKSITGPYVDQGVVIPHGSIDGHPFLDSDGQLYLYFTAETKNSLGLPRGRIYVYKMKDPLTIAGEPKELVGWNGWQEGAFIIKQQDEYWMTYSRNGWNSERYEVMLTKSDSPTGPFKPIENALIKSSEEVKGPGHNSIFRDHLQRPWLVYHGWDPKFKARYPRIDPMVWDGIKFVSPGPTMSPQHVKN